MKYLLSQYDSDEKFPTATTKAVEINHLMDRSNCDIQLK